MVVSARDDVAVEVLTDPLGEKKPVRPHPEEFARALVQVVADGGGPPQIADCLSARLKASVVIGGEDGRVLAGAEKIPALPPSLSARCFEPSGRMRTGHEILGLSRYPGSRGNHIVVPVRSCGTDRGRIAVLSIEGALTADDVPLVQGAAAVTALAITTRQAVRAVSGKYRADFLRDLLTGRIDPEQAVAHATSTGWTIDRPVVVVVADLDPLPEGPARRSATDRLADAWADAVRSRDPRAPVAGFFRDVVAVTGLPGDGDVDGLVRDLIREANGNGGGHPSYCTGVSRPATSPAAIPAAYEQARTAVRVGRRMGGPGTVSHFDRLGVLRLLSLVEDTAELRSFAEETLGELASADTLGHESDETADLRTTLEVLLETNLNVAETARSLHFHYNTLRYRIAKLERMLGPFTRDPQRRLSIQVALQILHLRRTEDSPGT